MSLHRSALGMATLFAGLAFATAAQAQVTVTIDQAPAQVTPGSTFEVSWTVNSPDPIAVTTVVHGEASRSWNKIGSIRSGAGGTTFRTNVTAPQNGTIYWVVYVQTGAVRGVTSERSIRIGNGPTPQPPAAASGLTANATSQTAVDLAWSDNSANERNFFVQRSTNGGAYAQVGVVPADTTAYSDTGLTANTTYAYRVVAGNDNGMAAPSNVATVTTPANPQPTPPAPPTGLTATANSGTQVALGWTDNSGDETAFLIGRRTGTTGQFNQIAQVGANTTTYTDDSVTAGNTYEYSVFATNAAGNSAGTNVVRVTTPTSGNQTITVVKNENPALAIPDDDTTGALSTLVVNQAGSILNLEIDTEIAHSWRGDIEIKLTSPQGTTATIFTANANDQDDDVRETFTTAAFNGQEVRGTWQLQVVDRAGQDTGVVESWTLRATIGTTTNPPQFGLEQRVPVTTLRFPLNGSTATPPTSLRRVRAFPNLTFTSPVFLTHAPDNTDRIFVLEQAGRIRVFPNNNAVTSASTFLDIRNRVASGGEMGLLGLAFDPSYRTNRTFYVYYTANSPRRTVVSRFTASATNPNQATTSSEQVILTVNQPFSNHNGGMIAFGPDNMLYIGLGDGGSGGDPQGHGQNRQTLLGNILRIDVRNSTTYRIPTDNPFVNTGGGVRGEIWAFGIRNPWRFSFDRQGGDLWCGDVGQNAREEIDLIRRGGNYGWNVREGTQRYSGNATASMIEPVRDYPHSQGRTVVGGYVYRGTRIAGMQGQYVYADYISDKVWTLGWNGTTVTSNREVASVPSIVSFGEDQAGELFAVGYGGQLYTFENNSTGGGGAVFPTLLSQTGIFSDLATLTPNPGIIPYDVNSPLWSDNSKKQRWIALPGNSRITFSATGNWQFPVGTVLIKHFGLEMTVGNPGTERRLETRVIIHEQAGWAGYTYKWNANQTDAELLASGDNETYTITDANAPGGTRQQTWSFPSRVDCMGCHTAASGRVLGPRTGQLNGDFDYPLMRDNQLRSWNNIQLFTTNIGATGHAAYVNPSDTSATLSQRARSYLASNCSHCHQPQGTTPVNIDFRNEATRNGMNVINLTPNSGNLGIPNAAIVREGNKNESVLWSRMGRLDARRMPQIGTNVVDAFGLDLIGQWIDNGAR